jgi:hypothetical protein
LGERILRRMTARPAVPTLKITPVPPAPIVPEIAEVAQKQATRTQSLPWAQSAPRLTAPAITSFATTMTAGDERRLQRRVEDGVVQRTIGESTATPAPETQPAAPPPPRPDLNALARDIFPMIKRLLAIERERRPR